MFGTELLDTCKMGKLHSYRHYSSVFKYVIHPCLALNYLTLPGAKYQDVCVWLPSLLEGGIFSAAPGSEN